jgi:AraC-like DNA-binding protein
MKASPRNVRTQSVLTYIEAHLGDPDLSCRTIAGRHRISERHLRNLFMELGSSPSEWIWRRRLERAREDIVDPSMTALSVTDICYRWGFKHAAHFSRAFKARYGCPPSEARVRSR